ncbi:sulfatase-like hydrolase/transferase [Larkinella humicola]|uniref:Sulfatase-like hydrolase/transferase n=1 Tax=Larkinella humicola TaxID=2607654 RepID=A0A5N1J4R5_9BACT|nr:sulfatase-like hydrolase/transferase [Larkinella humicola]KAA9341065.1 sulfatase-like hydrolase/transferase [Larkinella humicola]
MIRLKNHLLSLLLLGFFQGKAQTPADRPNILWIVSEDNNTSLIGCYGNSYATTPNIDRFATASILYKNAFSTAPVCAPSRNTLITGMYPPSLGTEHMRSSNPVPSFVKFFPKYLREAGYYTTNNAKKDYNTVDQPDAWDESSDSATYKKRKPGQPFFAVFNLFVSHESSLHQPLPALHHDPEKAPIPPYHPKTAEFKHDWAQYYDKVETMDQQFGKLLNDLKAAGLAENTIVFYYADNGGVLGRSKRFMYESGLHVPLIVHLPKKYAHLATAKAGAKTDQLVTFLDFAPTVLSLVGIKVPDYMQGQAFLGTQQKPERQYAYNFRGRMDEAIDLSRSVRDKKYRYIRNYLPHRIYGQHLDYLWRTPSIPAWEAEFKAGRLNETQARFWQPKPAEELYDVDADPNNVHNLATDPRYAKELIRLRKANEQWLQQSRDVGFIPEALLARIAEKTPLYDYARKSNYPLNRVIETATLASSRNPADGQELIQRLTDPDPTVRYWAATGGTVLKLASAKPALQKLLQDSEETVQVAAAEALYQLGETNEAVTALKKSLASPSRPVRLQALNALLTLGPAAAPAQEAALALIPTNPSPNAVNEAYDVRAAQNLLESLKK